MKPEDEFDTGARVPPTGREPGDAVDRLFAEMRAEDPDAAREEAAARRVWSRLSAAPAIAGNLIVIRGCEGYRALMPAYIARTLSDARALLLESHIRECAGCRGELAAARTAGAPHLSARPGAARRQRRGSSAALAWSLSAAAAMALAVFGLGIWRHWNSGTSAEVAEVQDIRGSLMLVSGETTTPLASRGRIDLGQPIRTAKDSGAFVVLSDGSRIEMKERSEISLVSRSDGMAIQLARGSIIVEAARQRTGHLYVATDDCLVSVTGTIFSVNHGTMGSRVSVIEGEVHVDQGSRESVLHPGDQVSTRPGLGGVPVEEEIAWSRDLESHLAVLHEMAALRKDLAASIPSPGLRHSTRLLDLVPAATMVYAAVPNIASSLSEASRIVRERVAGSEPLRAWWDEGMGSGAAEEQLQEAIGRIRAFGDHLGDEVVLAATADDNGMFGGFVLLSEVKRPAEFPSFLRSEVAKLNAEAQGGPRLRIVADAAEAGAGTPPEPHLRGDAPCEMLLWTRDDLFAAASSPALLDEVEAAQLRPEAARFASTPLRASLAQSYRDGVQWLVAADAHRLGGSFGHTAGGDALERTGLLDLRQFIVEQKQDGERTQDSAVLTFDGPRRGLASWLAAPAPMGSLQFISPDASLLGAFVVKTPASALEDLFGILSASDPGFAARVAEFEARSGVNVKEDLAAPLGGEFSIALDGPVLPVPAWKIVAEVYDPTALQRTIERLVGIASAPGVRLDRSEASGQTFYSLQLVDPSIEIHYTFVDGYLIAAPRQALLEQTIKLRRARVSLAASDAFTALLPRESRSDFSAVFYQNLGSILGSLSEKARGVGGAGLGPDQRRMLDELGDEMAPSLGYAYAEEDRIVLAASDSRTFGSDLASLFGFGDAEGIRRLLEGAFHPDDAGRPDAAANTDEGDNHP